MGTNNIELQPILVDSDTKNIADRLITPSTQTFYAHKATEKDYGVVTLGQINDAVNEHNEDPNAHSNALEPIKNVLNSHISNIDNPHKVTKEQIGLGNVPNIDLRDNLNKKVDKNVVLGENRQSYIEHDGSSISIGAQGTSDGYCDVSVQVPDNDTITKPVLNMIAVDGNKSAQVTLIDGSVKFDTTNGMYINGKKLESNGDKVDKSVTKESEDYIYRTEIDNQQSFDGKITLYSSKSNKDGDVLDETTFIVDETGAYLNNNKVADEKYVDDKVDSITAIQIRNKGEITATQATVQTVATEYMRTEYGREPQNWDGLILTITDLSNDKILYIYSQANSLWINAGINNIDLSNYVTKDGDNVITGDINVTGKLQHNGTDVATTREAQKMIILGADGIEETQVYSFEVQDASSYLPYRTSGTKFLVDLHLPVSGDLTTTKKVAITFGDTTYYVYNILKGGEAISIGDLHQVDKYNNATGYRFISEMIFFQTSDLTGFYIVPTVSMSDILALDSNEMDDYMADGGLTQGQLAICSKVITNGYTAGGLYRFDITYPTTYTWTELAGISGGLTVLTNSDFPLSADLLAKVKANPQDYIIHYNSYYYAYKGINNLSYKRTILTINNKTLDESFVNIDEHTGVITESHRNLLSVDNTTIKSNLLLSLGLQCVGINAQTNNQTLTGDDIYLATTIDIGDDA